MSSFRPSFPVFFAHNRDNYSPMQRTPPSLVFWSPAVDILPSHLRSRVRREAHQISLSIKTTKGDRILRIILESGILYTVSGVSRAPPYNTLGELFTPISESAKLPTQAAYTRIVLLLISTKKSLSDPTFLGTVPDALKMPSIEENPASTLYVVNIQSEAPALGPLGFGKDNMPSHRYQLSEATLV
ncbi:hypothetical protein R3P38DRAFT_3482568 [Favolaschia claudopus]|uniref:Uncharacterized protein n=1 Tax=Favolaschia claudopus TaxID=2862362 RepID=A0AAV9Z7Z4_9AGAR